MRRAIAAVAVACAALSGCATNDYATYAAAQSAVDIARHQADAAKYKAMADIAAAGDPSARVAAVMALALGHSASAAPAQAMAAPQASTALQWAQVLVPGLAQIAGISANMRVGLAQSDNAARVAISTNDAFTGIASKIQAPAASITTTTTDSHNTDNHTVTPAPVVTVPVISAPVVVSPSTKVCTIATATGAVTCQ